MKNFTVWNNQTILIPIGNNFGNVADSVLVENVGTVHAIIDSSVETFLLANGEDFSLDIAEFLSADLLDLILAGDGNAPVPPMVDSRWRFELWKLAKDLQCSGKRFEFSRPLKNDYGEPTQAFEVVKTLLGLYHETIAYITESSDSGGITRSARAGSAKVPKILCKYEAIEGLKAGDFTMINGKRFFVTGVSNVQEQGIIADISMRLQDDGFHVQY